MNKEKIKKNRRQDRGILLTFTIIFTIYSLILIFPFVWIFINSFKNGWEEFAGNTWALPKTPMFSNYIKIFQLEEFNIFKMFGNTLIICLIVPTLSTLSPTLAAYVMAKYNFKGHKVLYAVYIVPMLISLTGTTSSLYLLMDRLNLIGSYVGIAIMACGGTGFSFLLIYSVFKNVSDTYMEAARIDGAGDFRIFFQVMLPHAMGIIGTQWVLGFIGTWNDYQTPKIFLGVDHYTIATGIEKIGELVESSGGWFNLNYPAYFAAIILSIIPVVTLFLIFQKKIMSISLGGGIK